MSSRTWRAIAAPIIRDVLAQHAGAAPATIRKALREAYPFGARENVALQSLVRRNPHSNRRQIHLAGSVEEFRAEARKIRGER